ncbi:MAG: DUF2520 domain-containing protein [Desulfobacteraceae bacterium]|nr:DUF2520 domain-containing protein [Desulfobacteraceae bacterium]
MTTPSISIIGCGRVGTALAVFLARAGFPLAGVASRSLASARNTARLAGAGQVFDTPTDAAKNGNVLFITTPDAAIEGVFADLVAQKALQSGSVVFHCSGALSSGILVKEGTAGIATGSIHPLQSFAPCEAGQASPFKGINISVEGDDSAVELGTRMVEALGGVSFTIPTRAKTLYHAAAVVASNYLVTLERFAIDLLREAELSEARAYEILSPLILGTLSNIGNRGTVAALTGPVARGDREIVERHMADIEKVRPEYSELYRLLGQYTLKIAREGGDLDPGSADRLEALFKPPGS